MRGPNYAVAQSELDAVASADMDARESVVRPVAPPGERVEDVVSARRAELEASASHALAAAKRTLDWLGRRTVREAARDALPQLQEAVALWDEAEALGGE